MAKDYNITPEEISALFPQYEVTELNWLRVRKRIAVRTLIIVLLYLARAAILFFTPEYHIYTANYASNMGNEFVSNIVTFRVILLIVILIVYLYAVGYNLYLRTVSVVIISLLFALLWSDLETFIFHSLGGMKWYFVTQLVMRLVGLYLLFKNYLEIRQ